MIIQQSQQWMMDGHVESNLSNLMALWFDQIDDINWIGIYWLKNNALLVGPFQGKPACSPLFLDRGVCATAITQKRMQIVNDVHAFKGHIACDSASRSELVTLIRSNGKTIGVLDIDSPCPNRFDETTINLFVTLTDLLNTYLTKEMYFPLIR